MHNKLLKDLPSISALLETQLLRDASVEFGHSVVKASARNAVAELRERVQLDQRKVDMPTSEQLATIIVARLQQTDQLTLRPVINASGILLHTGLGRAPMAKAAVQAAAEAAREYCNVELNLSTGQRTRRSQSVADLLCQLTGAESAHVVNNNAGATALVLAALAGGREVIISHGELIEIGGGFRLPEVMETFGARLLPVGTTNITRKSDYERAITGQTGALLVVHSSNYSISGFAESPKISEIAKLAERHQVPLIHDIGSGALFDLSEFGCREEPVASESIQAGADLVLFSGDKLLGGPQAGIIVGRQEWIEKIHNHPLNRALRVDKVTLAALRATLKLHCQQDDVVESIPLLRYLSTPLDELQARATQLSHSLQQAFPSWEVQARPDEAYVGGGSVPSQAIASWCVSISAHDTDINSLALQLRIGSPSILARVHKEHLLLNLHSISAETLTEIAQAVSRAGERLQD